MYSAEEIFGVYIEPRRSENDVGFIVIVIIIHCFQSYYYCWNIVHQTNEKTK